MPLINVAPAMETLRVYRPRVAIHGSIGMGQGYVAAAALHHLEGYHVQSLELGNLMGDSTRVSLLKSTLPCKTYSSLAFTDCRGSCRSAVHGG